MDCGKRFNARMAIDCCVQNSLMLIVVNLDFETFTQRVVNAWNGLPGKVVAA